MIGGLLDEAPEKRKHLVAAREHHFRMPLDAHDEVLSRHLDSFDDPVRGSGDDDEPISGDVDGLVVKAIAPETLPEKPSDDGSFVRRYRVRRDAAVRLLRVTDQLLRQGGEILVERASESDVEDLFAAAYPEDRQISGDRKRLRQSLDQMLGAAITAFADPQFVPEGGRRILVHGEGDNRSARIIVSDNGPGEEPAGTHAVGLALARQLVAAHDGKFEQLHQSGEGAVTAMTLPR